MQRAQMARVWGNIISTASEKLGASAVVGANAYLLHSASLLREVPDKSIRFLFGDESIPFFQMVVHGIIAYTGQPMNLFYDDTTQRLKDIEYGFTPTMELTYQNTAQLANTGYQMLFTARYTSWHDTLKKVYHEQVSQFSDITDALMVKHEKLAEQVYQTCYDTGISVLVNYGKIPFTINGITVPALNYVFTWEATTNER